MKSRALYSASSKAAMKKSLSLSSQSARPSSIGTLERLGLAECQDRKNIAAGANKIQSQVTESALIADSQLLQPCSSAEDRRRSEIEAKGNVCRQSKRKMRGTRSKTASQAPSRRDGMWIQLVMCKTALLAFQ